MSFRELSRPLTESDGPFQYGYVSISSVPGLKLSGVVRDPVAVQTFDEISSEALLTNDCDPWAQDIDRSAAIGLLLLTGFLGSSRFGRISKWIQKSGNFLLGEGWTFSRALSREVRKIRGKRRKEHGGPGSYLIYAASGALLEPLDLHVARRIGNIGFGFDLLDREKYRALHRRALHSTVTALSLALNQSGGSPEIRFVSDLIYLTGPNDLTVYPKEIFAGAVGAIVTNQRVDESIQSASRLVPPLLNDSKLEGAVSLFVQSQRVSNDNLRAFIPAWSALELLVNRLARLLLQEWIDLLGNKPETVPKWDRNLMNVDLVEYRMRDRFLIVACVLDLANATADAQEFASINNKRSGYYHEQSVDEKDLPTHSVQALFRKYLSLMLERIQ